MENNKDIDDLFRDIVEPSEMDHSDNVWASVEGHIEKSSNDRNKGIIFRLRLALGILLCLFGSFIFYYIFSTKENSSKSLIAQKQQQSESVAKPSEIKKSNSQLKTKGNSKSINISQKEKSISSIQKIVVQNNTQSKVNNHLQISNKTVVESKSNSGNNVVSEIEKKNHSIYKDSVQLVSMKIISTSASIDSALENKNDVNNSTVMVTDSNHVISKIDSTNKTIPSSIALSSFSKEKLDSIHKQSLKNRLSVAVYFSPDFTMKYLKDNDATDNQNEGDYNNNEVSDFSYNTGLLLGYDLSKKWTVKFGVNYAYLAQTIKPKVVYATTGTDGLAHYQFNTTYGTSELPRDQTLTPAIGDSLNINSNSLQSLQILGIPLFAKYKIDRRKFSYYVQGGVSLNFLMSEKLTVEAQNKTETIKNTEGLNEYFIGGIFGLGVSYQPINRFSILFEPTIRGALTPINKNTPITTRPISLGVAMGFAWHF